MAVSANTLFHFTKFDTLQKILASQGFWPQYSKEHFENALPRNSRYSISYIPMVCFCDLKLTQLSDLSISQHTKDFGNYGIGFKKSWGIKNNISPVVYVHEKSIASKTIDNVISKINTSPIVSDNQIVSTLGEIVKFLKPYNGHYQKNKRRKNVINYYDEREWRYIPKETKYNVYPFTNIDENKIEELNKTLRKNLLKFTSKDIKYLIIDTDKDKQELSKAIQKMRISPIEKTDLTTKIITLQEIRDDF